MKFKTLTIIIMLMVGVVIIPTFGKAEIQFERFVYSEKSDMFRGQLLVRGLKSNAEYMLCINGKPGFPGNDILMRYGKHGSEGYYDFKRVKTDRGVLNTTWELRLPLGEYSVKFAIKDIADNWAWIEIETNVHFIIFQGPDKPR